MNIPKRYSLEWYRKLDKIIKKYLKLGKLKTIALEKL